jgi:hypothetical protein
MDSNRPQSAASNDQSGSGTHSQKSEELRPYETPPSKQVSRRVSWQRDDPPSAWRNEAEDPSEGTRTERPVDTHAANTVRAPEGDIYMPPVGQDASFASNLDDSALSAPPATASSFYKRPDGARSSTAPLPSRVNKTAAVASTPMQWGARKGSEDGGGAGGGDGDGDSASSGGGSWVSEPGGGYSLMRNSMQTERGPPTRAWVHNDAYMSQDPSAMSEGVRTKEEGASRCRIDDVVVENAAEDSQLGRMRSAGSWMGFPDAQKMHASPLSAVAHGEISREVGSHGGDGKDSPTGGVLLLSCAHCRPSSLVHWFHICFGLAHYISLCKSGYGASHDNVPAAHFLRNLPFQSLLLRERFVGIP